MGSTNLLPLSPSPTKFHFLILNPSKTSKTLDFPSNILNSSSSRPDSNHKPRSRRFGFDDDFGFRRREKRRNWWSDDDDDDDVDDDDDDDVDDDLGFEIWEEPSAIDWLLKILKAFGWMVPAVLISKMLGTGHDSWVMALVLPLGQTALSIAMDKLWGDPISSQDTSHRPRARSRSRPRPKRNPFVRTANGSRMSEAAWRSRAEKQPRRGSYQSWGSTNKGGQNGSSFGGWDELDAPPQVSANYTREEQRWHADELPRQNSGAGKFTRRRSREKPLLIRMLIAVFPFMGSWTRFLF